MRCYCALDLDELKTEYGRISRAHVTIMAALKAYKVSSPASTTQITYAAAIMGACELRLKKLIETKKEGAS